jgi:exopolysaccharide biosynthesis polyprenyl glycosylphosphotransferase
MTDAASMRPEGFPQPQAAIAASGADRRIAAAALFRRLLALSDSLAVIAAIFTVSFAAGGSVGSEAWLIASLPLWIVLAKLFGLYDRDQRTMRQLTVDELPTLATWAAITTAVITLSSLQLPSLDLSASRAVRIWFIAVAAAAIFRALVRAAWRRVVPPERALIVGEGIVADGVRRKLALFPDIHVAAVGQRATITIDDLTPPAYSLAGIDRIILALPSLDEHLVAQLVAACRREQIRLSVVPPAGLFGVAVTVNHVGDTAFIEYSTWDVSRSTLLLKRTLDLIVCIPALILLTPVFAAIAVAIKLDSEGPVLHRQRRGTIGGAPFEMLKFRTMVANAEALLPEILTLEELDQPMFKLRDDPRVTRVGRLLRRWSLDEMPQLVNVLTGEMTLVGPRPEQVELVERYLPEHRFRLSVRPGLTGPMQVFGRGSLTFEERLAVEREYIENLSLRRDLRILALTLAAVVHGRGAY